MFIYSLKLSVYEEIVCYRLELKVDMDDKRKKEKQVFSLSRSVYSWVALRLQIDSNWSLAWH